MRLISFQRERGDDVSGARTGSVPVASGLQSAGIEGAGVEELAVSPDNEKSTSMTQSQAFYWPLHELPRWR